MTPSLWVKTVEYFNCSSVERLDAARLTRLEDGHGWRPATLEDRILVTEKSVTP